ncbi:MAG: flagellar biosynthesis anti-sigma factor FlgM [Phycisphaerales bacterium]|nr:flagellar biosynthesis anti-sigma factor FlgM [Phycisphaerales bacterium]
MNGESRIGGISEGVSGVGSVGRLAGVSEPRVRDTQASASGQINRGEDKVELSTEAQVLAPWLNKLKQMPAIRQDLVDQIRGQIASGSYDTAEKMNAALDGMIDETTSGQIC